MWKNRIEYAGYNVDLETLKKPIEKIEEMELDIKKANKIWREKENKKNKGIKK